MIHRNTNLNFYLIRHAESEINQQPELIAGRSSDTLVSSNGLEQATMLGKRLYGERVTFAAIYSSTAVRSRMTAETVLKEMNIAEDRIIDVPELVEFTQGDWEGRSREDVYTPEILQYINTKGSHFIPPNGESQVMVEHRVAGWFLHEILHNPKYLNKESTIAIFSHGLTIKCFLHFVMHFDERLIHRIRLDNTAICKVRFTFEGWFIDSINDISHLHNEEPFKVYPRE